MRECLRPVWPVALTVSILCLAAVAAWIVVNSMNACLLGVSLDLHLRKDFSRQTLCFYRSPCVR